MLFVLTLFVSFQALQKYRNSHYVNEELAEMQESLRTSASSKPLSIMAVLRLEEIRWPLIVAVTLQIAQQLSGINAVRSKLIISYYHKLIKLAI